MTEDHKPNQSRTSYAYQQRDDLPGVSEGFYEKAGLSRAAFEIARAAQIVVQDKAQTRPDGADGARFDRPRAHRFDLPDPRPSYAIPGRRLRDEDWFYELKTARDGRALSRAEFEELRRPDKGPKRGRNRDRNR